MHYRSFAKKNENTSILGFGCMRLPQLNPEDSGAIDEQEAIRMIRYAIDNGVNYVDTAYPYHKGNSEIVVGKALKDGYREKVMLATKLPTWLINTREDCDKYLNEQLQKLDTDHIDVYLIHALNKERWSKVQEAGVLDFLDKALADGRIRHAGFSFHDDTTLFRTIVEAYDWSMCQLQFNYMEDAAWENEVKHAGSLGVSVVVMEPLLGGKLANNLNDEAKAIFAQVDKKRTPAEWALRWVCNHPEVSVVLSGMSTMSQVEENIKTADLALPNSLSPKELEAISQVKQMYTERMLVKCTACDYCQPCPNQVAISNIFSGYNNASLYNMLEETKTSYKKFLKAAKKDASQCAECGLCEAACPQKLPIIKYLKEAHQALDS